MIEPRENGNPNSARPAFRGGLFHGESNDPSPAQAIAEGDAVLRRMDAEAQLFRQVPPRQRHAGAGRASLPRMAHAMA